MNRTKLKNYAPQARRDFIQAMTDRAAYFGLTAKKIEPVVEKGDVAVIGGRSHPREVAKKRKQLEDRIKRHGFEQTMEALAYTWFNRLVAIRFMEVHGYLDHGYRVLSHPEGKPTPELLEHAEHVDLPGLKKEAVIDLKLAGNKESELYRLLLTAQCNALHAAMPFLFEKIDDETELLLPDNLLHSDSLIRKLVGEIDEEDWQVVEIIGWLYQFYISEKKDEVIGKVVASEDIPAATQLFTPNWIVKYLVQNTLGRQWLATYPQSALRQQMQYYIEPAEQTPDVQEQLKAITPTSLNPEELTLLDPACGSGHILVEAYDLFKAIYQERGYRAKDIPALILQKNLFGLEIDDRAAQLAAFALMMKARADDRRIFDSEAKPNVVALQAGLELAELKDVIPEDSGDYKDFAYLHATYRNAKTFGSLIQPVHKPNVLHPHFEKELKTRVLEDLFSGGIATHTMQLLQQHKLLTRQYDAVVANPPYMGSKFYIDYLKEFIAQNYADAKGDLCTCFIDRSFSFLNGCGRIGYITMQSWMFLSSFEDFRANLLKRRTVATMSHLGPHAFPQIGGEVVQVTAFTATNLSVHDYRGSFKRLIDGSSDDKARQYLTSQCFTPKNDTFSKFPGKVFCYWVSDAVGTYFENNSPLKSIGDTRQGMATTDNQRFLRFWHEVGHTNVMFGCSSTVEAKTSDRRWFPYNKGGGFRKWYGNAEYVINWLNDGQEIVQLVTERYGSPSKRITSKDRFFQPSISWSKVSGGELALRYFPAGFIFDVAGCSIFFGDDDKMYFALALLNSIVTKFNIKLISPTINYEAGHLGLLPLPSPSVETERELAAIARQSVSLAEKDWDSHETSWNFVGLPWRAASETRLTIAADWNDWKDSCELLRGEQGVRERRINEILCGAYGVNGELEVEVADGEITLYRPDREEDAKRLLSYAIGCMMGRYSLDKPGLVYAHSGNEDFDASQYKSFNADDDGIIPLLETDWGIRDDATSRLVEFIGVAWPKEHLEENLKFVADSLGPNNGEQARATIRRYLATGFYKHHLSMYKKRPIYWLFSSGKQRAFQCLVYLHRYHEGTLARMRTEYVIPLQGQIAARIEQLEGDKTKATSTSHRNKLQKEQIDLKKQEAELRTFEEKLKHAADKKISLDLDDGVKVNYAKFGDLLAEAKAITGGKDEE